MTTGIPHGPLSSADLPKLTGLSVLLVVLPPHIGLAGRNQPPLGAVIRAQPQSPFVQSVFLPDYEPDFGWHVSRFTYLGERPEPGSPVILAPEGGWLKNPVPGRMVRVEFRSGVNASGLSDDFDWSHETRRGKPLSQSLDIVSFSLIEDAKPEECGCDPSYSTFRCTVCREREEAYGRELSADRPAQAPSDLAGMEGGWRTMESAPKDRTPIRALIHADLYPRVKPGRDDLERWNGQEIVIHHPGLASDGFDIGWSLAAPVGHGGFPDEWFVGWLPTGATASPPAETGEGYEAAWLKAEAHLSEISAAIGSDCRFMDPPDGGDVTLAEQVRRMRAALDEAEAIMAALSATPASPPAEMGEGRLGREYLARQVREAWVRWAKTQPDPKASWLVPYDGLSEPDKEADRQIGEHIRNVVLSVVEERAALEAFKTPLPVNAPSDQSDTERMRAVMSGAFITTESVGHPNPEKRTATLKIAFCGEDSLDRAWSARDVLRAALAEKEAGQ